MRASHLNTFYEALRHTTQLGSPVGESKTQMREPKPESKTPTRTIGGSDSRQVAFGEGEMEVHWLAI